MKYVHSVSTWMGGGGNIKRGNPPPPHSQTWDDLLSVYSTAMQTPSRWGLALVLTPNARISHWGYQHVGIEKLFQPPIYLTDHHLPNMTPNASRWNIGRVGSPRIGARVGHVHFICCSWQFHLRWVANTNALSSGIWD